MKKLQQMQYLAKKIAYQYYIKEGVPYQKNEFPKLSSMCIKVLTENFTLYPDMVGLGDDIKEEVLFFFFYDKKDI